MTTTGLNSDLASVMNTVKEPSNKETKEIKEPPKMLRMATKRPFTTPYRTRIFSNPKAFHAGRVGKRGIENNWKAFEAYMDNSQSMNRSVLQSRGTNGGGLNITKDSEQNGSFI